MSWLWMTLCAVLFLAGLGILIWERIENAHQLVAMRKMRAGDMYAALYPVLMEAKEKGIDEVRLEKDRITFMGIVPPGKSAEFQFTAEGFRCPDAKRLETLTQLIALDVEDLQSEKKYALHRYRIMRPNGDTERGYVYSARQAWRVTVRRRLEGTEMEKIY